MWIGHRKEFTDVSSVSPSQLLETSAFKLFTVGQFTLSTQLKILNNPVCEKVTFPHAQDKKWSAYQWNLDVHFLNVET